MIAFLAAGLAAIAPATPVFDLAQPAERTTPREEAAPAAPTRPRGMDTREVAVDAPEVEMALLDVKQGPMLRVGALGGRHNAAPKLAHIAVGWRF